MASTWDELIELGNLVETIEYGEPIKSIMWREVYANLLDDNRSEFYQAASVGLRPELTFEVHDFEFNNDEYVKYKGKEFTIIRAPKRGDKRELIVSGRVGVEV